MHSERETDDLSGIETTGHSWDGIKELNNPLPRWWLLTFYATVAFAAAYVVAYPALPGLNGASQGFFGWSSRADLRVSVDAASAGRAASIEKIKTMDVASILKDEGLRTFSISAGGSAFKVYCSQCHGSGAAGAVGYPNLNDDSWLWGGKPDQIYTTIKHGVRFANDPDTRISEMTAFGRDQVLDAGQISDVAWFVRKLSGQQTDEPAAARGVAVFADNCAACHGEKGEGNKDLGAPQLNDSVWLYGGGHDQIAGQVRVPRHGVMPAWGGKLDDALLKELAVYVHSLGGGEKVE